MKSTGLSENLSSETSGQKEKKMFRMPQSKFSKSKKAPTFSLPLGFTTTPSEDNETDETDEEEVSIMERDRLEIERIRKRRMYEKGIRYNIFWYL